MIAQAVFCNMKPSKVVGWWRVCSKG